MSGRYEEPDQTPVEWPLRLTRPLTLQEEIARFMRVDRALQGEQETLEEADDFDVEDDEGDFADGVDRAMMAADRRYEEAFTEFDQRLAEQQREAKPQPRSPSGVEQNGAAHNESAADSQPPDAKRP